MVEIKSPCIGICKSEDKVCIGCHRTEAQIKTWNNLNDAAKTCVLGQANIRGSDIKGAASNETRADNKNT